MLTVAAKPCTASTNPFRTERLEQLRFRLDAAGWRDLLARGRLVPDQAEPGPGVYGLRHDPVAVQMVLNLLDRALGCADR